MYYTDYGSNVPIIEHTKRNADVDVNDQELYMKVNKCVVSPSHQNV